MGVTAGPARVRSEGADRRRQLTEFLPVARAALERDRAFRVEQLAALTAAGGTVGAPADDARVEVDALVADGARQALSDIEHALAAMQTGRYGRCEDCGEDISIAMLRAVPKTRWCMDCHGNHDDRTDDASTRRRSQGGTDVDGRPSRRAHPSCSRPARADHPVVRVRALLGRSVTGPQGQHLGHVQDVLATRQDARTVVTGLVADVGGLDVVTPITAIRRLHGPQVVVHSLALGSSNDPEPGELPLGRCAIGMPVLTGSGAVHRVADIALRHTAAGWVVWAADTGNVLERFLGTPRRLLPWDALVGRRIAPVPPARAGSRAW